MRSSTPRKVLLVGWAGADWHVASSLIDAGEMPQLANIVANGASGPLASLPPFRSPLSWTSLATGKHVHRHGILGWTAPDLTSARTAPSTSLDRRCKALWNILGEQGLTTHVLGWLVSHPAERINGIGVTDAFPTPTAAAADGAVAERSVHPAELTSELAELRLRPGDVDPALLKLFVPSLAEIPPGQDSLLRLLAVRLAELYSIHNAAIAALASGPCDLLAVAYRLVDRVARDFHPFHPPRQPHVSEREFGWYKDVLHSAYRLQDLLLRDLLAHAGSRVTVVVCSDRALNDVSAGAAFSGSHSLRPSPGIFAAAGPGIARDVLLSGARIIDVAPTVLHLFDLPVAADMDGTVLTASFAEGSPAPRVIPTWENHSDPPARGGDLVGLSAVQQQARLEHLVALGDLRQIDETLEPAALQHDRENRWSLALALRHARENEHALSVLKRLHSESPEDPAYACELARCQLQLGLGADAGATAETIADFVPGNALAHQLLAEFALARGEADVALVHLDQAVSTISATNEAASPDAEAAGRKAAVLLLRGAAQTQLQRPFEAAAAFREAVEMDRENPVAWLGYAQALLGVGRLADAEACARAAISLAPLHAPAHAALGSTLACRGHLAQAREALLRARELDPRSAAIAQALHRLDENRASDSGTGDVNRRPFAILARHPNSSRADAALACPPCAVRRAHPHECARIATAFPHLRLDASVLPIVLVASAGGVERLVGVASVLPPVQQIAGVSLMLRSRFVRLHACGPLVDASCALARKLGARELVTVDDLRQDDPRLEALASRGFAISQTHEIWSTPLAAIRARVDLVQERLARKARAAGYVAYPISPDDLDSVRALLDAENLLGGEHITPVAGRHGQGIDAGLSFVVRDRQQLVGALLARPIGRSAVAVMAEVVAPGWRGACGVVHHALLRACIEASAVREAREFIYTVDTGTTVDTARMARRSGSRALGRTLRLKASLALSAN